MFTSLFDYALHRQRICWIDWKMRLTGEGKYTTLILLGKPDYLGLANANAKQ